MIKGRHWVFWAFVLVAIVQLSVPASMIIQRERVLAEGKEYWFRTAPVDPSDPFRGKYITLSFEDNLVSVEDEMNWQWGQDVYLTLKVDSLGFARIERALPTEPNDTPEYIKAQVSYVSTNATHTISVDFPFDRFYMEESKALAAEIRYRKSLQDDTQTTFAVVSVKEGQAVLKDVVIDEVSIVDAVRQERSKVPTSEN